jgi:hypothetical protein
MICLYGGGPQMENLPFGVPNILRKIGKKEHGVNVLKMEVIKTCGS